MVLVDVGPVVVLTTGHTLRLALVLLPRPAHEITYTTTGMLAMLADTSVTCGDVAAVLAGLGQSAQQSLVMRIAVSGSKSVPGGHIDGCGCLWLVANVQPSLACAKLEWAIF
jgi:hypothetical protein